MEMVDENKLVCNDCGGTVTLHMQTSGTLFAQCACEWARVEDIPKMKHHVWWPFDYLDEDMLGEEFTETNNK